MGVSKTMRDNLIKFINIAEKIQKDYSICGVIKGIKPSELQRQIGCEAYSWLQKNFIINKPKSGADLWIAHHINKKHPHHTVDDLKKFLKVEEGLNFSE